MRQGLFILLFFILLAGCTEDTPDYRSLYKKGVALAVRGDFKKAGTTFEKVAKDDENRDAAKQSLSVIEETNSQRLNRKAARYFFNGIQSANSGKDLVAFSYFSNAIQTEPDFATAHYERGIIYGRLKLHDKAIADFTRAIEINTEDSAAYNNRGLAYAKGLKEYGRAIEDFTRAIHIDPQFAEAYNNRAITYQVASDDKEKACNDWRKACELKSCNSYNLAKQNGYCQ